LYEQNYVARYDLVVRIRRKKGEEGRKDGTAHDKEKLSAKETGKGEVSDAVGV